MNGSARCIISGFFSSNLPTGPLIHTPKIYSDLVSNSWSYLCLNFKLGKFPKCDFLRDCFCNVLVSLPKLASRCIMQWEDITRIFFRLVPVAFWSRKIWVLTAWCSGLWDLTTASCRGESNPATASCSGEKNPTTAKCSGESKLSANNYVWRDYFVLILLSNLPTTKCSREICLPAAWCSGEIWIPAASCGGEISAKIIELTSHCIM